MFILASLRELVAVREVYTLWLAGNKVEGNLLRQLFFHKMKCIIWGRGEVGA